MTINEYNLAVNNYADNVFRFVLKHLWNEMSAKDVVQETFTKVWIKRDDIDHRKVKSYLFTAAYNTMLDWILKYKRLGDIEPNHEYGIENNTNPDLREILDEALGRLPEIQKSVVFLRDYEG